MYNFKSNSLFWYRIFETIKTVTNDVNALEVKHPPKNSIPGINQSKFYQHNKVGSDGYL